MKKQMAQFIHRIAPIRFFSSHSNIKANGKARKECGPVRIAHVDNLIEFDENRIQNLLHLLRR